MIAFTLNGRPVSIEATDETSLVDVLRDQLKLTGTKLVCGAGVCGACTVRVDGHAVVSCLTPLANVAGRCVDTVEGLADGDTLHPVQKAFMVEDALQCGFCTPGFVVAAAAFYETWRAQHGTMRPSDEVIGEALSGHLCRCGAYAGIYRAVAAACMGHYDTKTLVDTKTLAPARVEARDKVTGAARYTVDMAPDGMLVGLLLRSPHAHAVVRHLDLEPARAMAGVAAVVSILGSDNTVRFAGQEIAAVAASSSAVARAALAQIVVRYEIKPAVFSPRSATDRRAPLVYTGWRKSPPNAAEGPVLPMTWSGNRRGPSNAFSLNRSAAKRAVAAARDRGDRSLVELTFHCDGQSHTCLEPHGAVVEVKDNHASVHASTQAPQFLAERIKNSGDFARATVHAEHVGGGFGSKVGLGVETRAATALAQAAGRPVKVAFDRAEELSYAGHRPSAEMRLGLLPHTDGSLDALSIEVQSNAGVAVNSIVAALGRLMYQAKSKDLVDWDVVTNTPPGSPFRAPGGPTLAFGLEQAIDVAAIQLGRDQIEVRRAWDDDPNRRRLYAWAEGLDVWRSRAAVGVDKGRFRRGVGVAAGNWLYFSQAGSEVELRIERGHLVAAIGAEDMGQGARTVLAETIARAFNLDALAVRVEIGRSDLPPGPMAAGSRSTATIVPAALAAADKLKTRLRASVRGTLSDNAPWADVIAAAPDITLRAVRPADHDTRQADARNPLQQAGMIGSVFDWVLRRFAHVTTGRGVGGTVQIAEVEVDTWLGRTRVVRFWSGLTIGKPQVPRLARSQAEGSIIQGIGYALYEAREYDPATGRVLSAGLEDYRLPGIADTPEMMIHFDEAGFDHVPGGGIGIGEVATVPVAAAIANAMHHATGVRFTSSPMRPDRVLAALSRARGA